MTIKELALEVLQTEAQSILELMDHIHEDFTTLVKEICASRGRVIISGIGKSGLIGRKIAATLSSTGTNSIFLHPVEALHGDLGMVSSHDIVIAISNSGETVELNALLPEIRNLGCRIAGFTGKPDSSMAKLCDLVIYTGVKKEACPLNMAPTASTTAQLAMGDALAVALIHEKKFQESDFIKSHPGGVLGQRLSFKICEVMADMEKTPWIYEEQGVRAALEKMDACKLGAVIVTNKDLQVLGIITDGDIRHTIAVKGTGNLESLSMEDIMTKNPHCLEPETFVFHALNLMEKHQITVLPLVNEEKKLQGMLHLHDILGKGAFQYTGGNP